MTRTVQGFWIGSDLSPMERMTIGSFLSHGHEFHLYTYGDVGNIPDGTKVMDAASILPRSSVFMYRTDRHAGSYAGFANLFRFKLLAERGGIWTDMDLVCMKPFGFMDLAFSSERMVDLARLVPTATVLAAPDGPNAFFAECHAMAAAMDPAKIRIRENSAFVLERLIREHGLERHVLDPMETGPVEWWALQKLIMPPEPALPDCSGVHLWHEMWRIRGIDKRRIHPPNTMYGRFQREYP